jgi:hypothetical protein
MAKKIRTCAKCNATLSGSSPHFDMPGTRFNFCNHHCKSAWINEYRIGKYKISKRFITDMDIYITPDGKKNLADPSSTPEIVVDVWALLMDPGCNKGVRRETLRLKFDFDNKKLVNKNDEVIEFENGEEMTNKVIETLSANI